ncbi:MAG TPA: excinuclease ABC subunit UvrC [Firmicutes bacterium]|nr:excinuclease ABC subunit UvrC [Bacillota bacterium]
MRKTNMNDQLREKVTCLPDLPGVYLLKDGQGRIIYVGKAISLHRRVRAYLVENRAGSPRLKALQKNWEDLDYIVTDSEVEALILECNLIKEYSPRFNVLMKDDKDYPYLILTPELYPRLELLRLSQKNSPRARYQPVPGREELRYGPYTDVGAVREAIRFLGSLFPLRRCRQPLEGSPASNRPCLNFQMKRCLAPCRGRETVSPAEYDRVVAQVVLFLQGRYDELEKKLKKQMEEAAAAQRFEEAAVLRDRLQSLQRVTNQQQKMLSAADKTDRDILALVRSGKKTAVHLFRVRSGKMLSREHFPLSGTGGVADDEVMASFIKNYYNRSEEIPAQIVLSINPVEAGLLAEWLRKKRGRTVTLRQPKRGHLKKLVELAERNGLLRLQEEEERRQKRTVEPLQELARLCRLQSVPSRIEAYDISHLRGDQAVGAMVVFRDGEPDKAAYRHFNIRQAHAGDDYGALQEVLTRRSKKEHWPQPDLILVDGGRGQLRTVREALRDTGLSETPLVALAKDPDRLFMEKTSLSVRLAPDDRLLQFLQRIRDEVHRFAVSSHRQRRSRRGLFSKLEDIPGVGPARRAALLSHFGSIEGVRRAELNQLTAVPGISASLAAVVYNELRKGEENC